MPCACDCGEQGRVHRCDHLFDGRLGGIKPGEVFPDCREYIHRLVSRVHALNGPANTSQVRCPYRPP